MSDLRSACIEAMARVLAMNSYGESNPTTIATLSPQFRPDAEAALHALLGVLEKHADEWAEATVDGKHSWHVRPTDVFRLLAVLREDT